MILFVQSFFNTFGFLLGVAAACGVVLGLIWSVILMLDQWP